MKADRVENLQNAAYDLSLETGGPELEPFYWGPRLLWLQFPPFLFDILFGAKANHLWLLDLFHLGIK